VCGCAVQYWLALGATKGLCVCLCKEKIEICFSAGALLKPLSLIKIQVFLD